MSAVLDKAQELADAISESDELEDLREAAERLDEDEIASAAIKQFQDKQETIRRAASSGLELPEDHINELKELQGRISDIPTVQDFAAAQNGFNVMMSKVNDIIAAAVTGVIPGEDEGGSGHGPGCGCG
ncbi:MAG: YlbF family regulator [Gaiellales bacterium]|nr:MAG: YlbF family regulator [Gaiellales bacterium]